MTEGAGRVPDFDDPNLSVLDELALIYAEQGYRLALTGGALRDYLMGRAPQDYDLTSDATPDESVRILTGWAGSAQRSPNGFGVVTCAHQGLKIQVLTFRTPRDRFPGYDPARLHADPLVDQLSCADVTIHTAALVLPTREWLDPFGGEADVRARVLRTPIDPVVTISSYPPTMLRYARFAAQLDFRVAPEVMSAMTALAGLIEENLTWHAAASLSKILMSPKPEVGMAVLRDSGILDHLPRSWQQRFGHIGAA